MKSFLVTINGDSPDKIIYYECLRADTHYEAALEALKSTFDGEVLNVYEVPGEKKRFLVKRGGLFSLS